MDYWVCKGEEMGNGRANVVGSQANLDHHKERLSTRPKVEGARVQLLDKNVGQGVPLAETITDE